MSMRVVSLGLFVLAAACSAQEGGNWAKGSTLAVVAEEESEYPESVADQASMRVPCATVRGVTNHRFQNASLSDIPIYVWFHHVKPFIQKHQDQILKYLPKAIQTAVKINQEKNVILAAIPVWLKVLKRK